MTTRVLAFVSDLMDRSRISAALGDDHEVHFVRDTHAIADHADVRIVVIDLGAFASCVGPARAALGPEARIVAFGAHVDDARLRDATTAGASNVLPRSRFFRNVRIAALGPLTDR